MSGEADAVADGDADAAATGDADPTDADAADEDLDTAEEIMRATYRALCAHGYADLTTQDIADESATSKAALHYHYDTKEELLVAFLDYLLDKFITEVEVDAAGDPRARLDTLVDALLSGPDEEGDFQVAMLELRSQTPYVEAYGEALRANDAYLTDLLAETVADGVAAGVFRDDVDPDAAAETILLVVDGARTRSVVFEDGSAVERARETIERYVERELLAAPSSEA